VPNSLQYPLERERELQHRWNRLLQRSVAPKDHSSRSPLSSVVRSNLRNRQQSRRQTLHDSILEMFLLRLGSSIQGPRTGRHRIIGSSSGGCSSLIKYPQFGHS
jgi:hypothetical protein